MPPRAFCAPEPDAEHVSSCEFFDAQSDPLKVAHSEPGGFWHSDLVEYTLGKSIWDPVTNDDTLSEQAAYNHVDAGLRGVHPCCGDLIQLFCYGHV